ncbi:hypothetical protein CTAM01_09324 [Colletotrichum tamarilloi]|uniref:Uncharacterized protein n=1 Tax=Colletotrichum tamarilloi TaxID=1209934 RepID=A0ABQ9R446_9PEZI|nr:uncharacterized protein CTAM01_09324 [Colletotrichum tamarilloi]KAK1493863.1 hypothetical protein CTAM01_09324 [Colletotrichum tamarilloi]
MARWLSQQAKPPEDPCPTHITALFVPKEPEGSNLENLRLGFTTPAEIAGAIDDGENRRGPKWQRENSESALSRDTITSAPRSHHFLSLSVSLILD